MRKTFLLLISSGLLLTACVSNPEGEKAETTTAQEVGEATGKVYQLNPQESVLTWTGRKVSATHHGKVNFKSGNLLLNDGVLTGGSFIADMSSITNEDLEGEWNEKLVGHLKSDEFFHIEKHPEATFEITGVQATDNPNTVTVSGNLTILGVSKNITFPAEVKEVSDSKVNMSSDFNIEREEWGLTYKGAPDDLISKEINFKIDIVAKS